MTDLMLGGLWLGVLGAGIGACVVAHALGLASTYVRDVLHIGAGIWILGWPYWRGDLVPIAIVAAVAVATLALPFAASRWRIAARIVRSVTNGDEHWTGLVQYTAMYALFTALGLTGAPFPAAAALLSLSLGDGIGGAIGRSAGRHHYRVRGAKQKSIEGSLAVLVAACGGIALAAHLFGPPLAPASLVALACVAALAEAVAPRGSDNLLVPLAVWIAVALAT